MPIDPSNLPPSFYIDMSSGIGNLSGNTGISVDLTGNTVWQPYNYGLPLETWSVRSCAVHLLDIGHGLYKVQARQLLHEDQLKTVDLCPAFLTPDKTIGILVGCHIASQFKRLENDSTLALEEALSNLAKEIYGDIRAGSCVVVNRERLKEWNEKCDSS